MDSNNNNNNNNNCNNNSDKMLDIFVDKLINLK